MLFVIHAIDVHDALSARLSLYDEHKAYLEKVDQSGEIRIVMSGPLLRDDGQTMLGSFFLVEAPNRRLIEEFHDADPFKQAGIWDKVNISVFLRRRG
jgi:uncharacterized protein